MRTILFSELSKDDSRRLDLGMFRQTSSIRCGQYHDERPVLSPEAAFKREVARAFRAYAKRGRSMDQTLRDYHDVQSASSQVADCGLESYVSDNGHRYVD